MEVKGEKLEIGYDGRIVVREMDIIVKKGEITRVAFTNEQLHKYFPSRYTPAMMKREIIALLKIWQNENWEK